MLVEDQIIKVDDESPIAFFRRNIPPCCGHRIGLGQRGWIRAQHDEQGGLTRAPEHHFFDVHLLSPWSSFAQRIPHDGAGGRNVFSARQLQP
jgi:hypothetical protein